MNHDTPAGAPADPLVTLQLRVARRADEIASRLDGRPLSLNLPCWLKAEEEVFACAVTPTKLLAHFGGDSARQH